MADEVSGPITITRSQLYDLVWSQPQTKLAERWGVSDLAVANWCVRLRVPRPGRGHWARIAHGREMPRPTLRTPPAGAAESIVVQRTQMHRATETEVEHHTPDVEAILNYWRAPEHAIRVSPVLKEPHHLVDLTLAAFARSKVVENALLTTRHRRHLALSVTGASLDRALRILDALIRALEPAGLPVVITGARDEDPYRCDTVVEVLGERLRFSISERFQRHERALTPVEKREKAKNSWYYISDRFSYTATGRLTLRIDSAPSGVRSSWSDGKRRRVEDCLTAFAGALPLAVDKIRRDRVEAEERRQQWEAEEARRRELAEQRLEAARAERALDVVLADWNKSWKIRALVEAVEALISSETAPDEAANLREWCDWARAVAARDDPVSRSSFLKLIFDSEPLLSRDRVLS